MGTDNLVFLENIEWLDDTGQALLQRIPTDGSGEIKFGAQLTVRESQAAVFFYQGRAIEAYGPGRHTLITANIPILNKIMSIPWGMSSPLRAEVYFVNLKIFTNLRWGTRDPVAFRDSELGLVRLRAFGVFNLQVCQPLLFINNLVGTQGVYTTAAIEEYLNRVIVSRFNDYMGEKLDSILDLAARYDELSAELASRLSEDFGHFGLRLRQLYINSITPPPEVQAAIDDRGRIEAVGNLEKLIRMKAAMAMEKATETGAAADGMGAGIGLMMPAMFARYLDDRPRPSDSGDSGGGAECPDCHRRVTEEARFCPSCGHQLLVFRQCRHCGKNMSPGARFCPRCGRAAEEKPASRICAHCGAENLPDSVFCNQCGEKH